MDVHCRSCWIASVHQRSFSESYFEDFLLWLQSTFLKSISKWSGLLLPTPAGAWTQSPLPLVGLYQAGKTHRQILHWVQTKELYNRLQIVVVKERSPVLPQSSRVYSKWSSFYWVLELYNFHSGQRNLRGRVQTLTKHTGPFSSDLIWAAWLR